MPKPWADSLLTRRGVILHITLCSPKMILEICTALLFEAKRSRKECCRQSLGSALGHHEYGMPTALQIQRFGFLQPGQRLDVKEPVKGFSFLHAHQRNDMSSLNRLSGQHEENI